MASLVTSTVTVRVTITLTAVVTVVWYRTDHSMTIVWQLQWQLLWELGVSDEVKGPVSKVSEHVGSKMSYKLQGAEIKLRAVVNCHK